MKPIRLTPHAKERCVLRGASEEEVIEAVRAGEIEPAKAGRKLCRLNFAFNRNWQGQQYAIKQVAAVTKEDEKEIVVVTVYTYYF